MASAGARKPESSAFDKAYGHCVVAKYDDRQMQPTASSHLHVYVCDKKNLRTNDILTICYKEKTKNHNSQFAGEAKF